MKAMALMEPGAVENSPLRLTELPVPEPGAGEVLIRVDVCGTCRTDSGLSTVSMGRHRFSVAY